MKYHYEYELKTDNLCYGSLSKGLFKTYAEAYNEMKILQNKYGTMAIYKIRVYNDKDLKQYKNFSRLFNVVHNLKNSQGFYSRLYNNLVNLTEIEMLEIEKQLPDFSDEVDVILFLEN